VSSTHPASEDSAPPATTPMSVRVAVIVLSVLAGLLLLNAGLTLFGREQVVDALVASGDISRSEAGRRVVLWTMPYLVLGLVMAASAWSLPRRHPWSRWVGLAATVVLGLLTLFSVVVSGGITFGSLLLLVLSIAAVTSLLSPTTGAWTPPLRGRA
jgi:hypothetical protein